MAKARAKGQPRTAPTVKSTTAESVRWLSLLLGGTNACDIAYVVVYMAKEDGRRAEDASDPKKKEREPSRILDIDGSPVDAFHMPALATNMKSM